MKKYFILGISVLVIAILVSFAFKQEPSAGTPGELVQSFYGTARVGATVHACLQPYNSPCYEAVAGKFGYSFPEDIEQGDYWLTDGCWNTGATYSGTPVRVDFCIPTPGNECLCN